MLKLVMKKGKRVNPAPPVAEIREYVKTQLNQLPEELRDLNKKFNYAVKVSGLLKQYDKTISMDIQ